MSSMTAARGLVTTLHNALARLVNDSMWKDHPEASDMAIAAINEANAFDWGDREMSIHEIKVLRTI